MGQAGDSHLWGQAGDSHFCNRKKRKPACWGRKDTEPLINAGPETTLRIKGTVNGPEISKAVLIW
jgi:hypothetical protein